MPRIREYQQQVSAQADMPGRRAQASDFGGDGISRLGGAVGAVGDMMYEAQERQEVTEVHARLAKARADWTVALQERAQSTSPGDATFAPKFNEDFTKYLHEIEGGLQTKGAQNAFRRGAADLSAHFVEKSGVYQAQQMGMKAKQDYLVLLDANRNALLSDPTQHGAVMQATLDALNDPSGMYARMPAADRERLAVDTRKQLALSAVQGTIEAGAPELAKRQLTEGKWDSQIDPDHKKRLMDEADVAIRAKDTAAERQRMLEKREREDRREAVSQGFLARIVDPKGNGGPLSDKEILANKELLPAEKEHFINYKMRRARELSERTEARTNPAAVRELMLQIHANPDDPKKTYNMEPVMDAYRAGRISTAEMGYLRKEVEQLRDGNTQGFQKDVHSARNAVYTMLSRSIIGSMQPEIAADAAYRFQRDLDSAIERKRKANEDPRSLLDPESKDYMLRPARIQSYLPAAREALREGADKVRAAAPGEARGKMNTARRLPTYQDRDALKPGDQYTDPQGNIRTKQ